MNAHPLHLVITALALLPAAAANAETPSAGGAPPTPAVMRKIPGITAEDPFPQGCVDCHVRLPDRDVRLSTMMAQWNQSVDEGLLARVQRFAPRGVTLVGKHPPVPDALNDIPAACFECHNQRSSQAPPFARMLHGLHLGGGEQSHFLAEFQGECTYCHKWNRRTGEWSLPSGAEP